MDVHEKKILSVSSNKESLTDFFRDYIKKHGTTWLSEHPECEIILAGGLKDGTKVISLTSSGAQEVTNLQYTKEEADTRMTFHAVKADLSFKENSVKGRVIIKFKDTDALVLAIHYHPQMSCGLNVEQQQQLGIYINLFLYIKYARRKYHFCLNKLRSKLALQKCNTIVKLPTCEDAFKQHVKRAIWQTKI